MGLASYRHLALRLQGARLRDSERVVPEDEAALASFLGPAHRRLNTQLSEETEGDGQGDGETGEGEGEGGGEGNQAGGELDFEKIIEELQKISPEAGSGQSVAQSVSGHQFQALIIAALGANFGHLDGLGDENIASLLLTLEPEPGFLTLLFSSFSGVVQGVSPVTLVFTGFDEEPQSFLSNIYLFGPGTPNQPAAFGQTETLTSPPLPGFGEVEVTYQSIAEVTVKQTTTFDATPSLTALSAGSATISAYNFQIVDVAFGTSLSAGDPVGSVVTIGPMGAGGLGVMRGSVTTGAGDDVVDITAYSFGGFGDSARAFSIATDGGEDTISFTGTDAGARNNNVMIDAGAGNDTVTLGDFYAFSTINGGPGVDTLSGGSGDDTIQVSGDEAEFDTMTGGGGTDGVENVGGGDVTLDGFDSTTNSIETFDGDNYAIRGNDDTNILDFSGTALIDVDAIEGGAGDDTITGTSAAETIRPGAGIDQITTGGGADIVDLDPEALGTGLNTVTDFTTGVGGDVLDVADLLTGYVPGTSDINDFVAVADSGGDTQVSVDVNGPVGGASFQLVAEFEGVVGLNTNTLLADGNLDPET